MAFNAKEVDVAICGGGPTGLMVALGLLKAGVSCCIMDMPTYGRACSIFPRSLELLDSYGLWEEMNQIGFIDLTTFTHRPVDRECYPNNSPNSSLISNTFFDFVLNLRAKYSEAIVQKACEENGGIFEVGCQVTDIAINSNSPTHSVVIRAKDLTSGNFKLIRSRYLIGADGVSSLVRKFAGIQLSRSHLSFYWVRVDGVVETNYPDANAGQTIFQSQTHGTVIFSRLDHGRTRLGFCLTPDLLSRYGLYITQQQAVHEAQQALKPWRCTFEEVDWYTCYSVRNGAAETFVRTPIILAGDACHSHASGTGQGLNAGIQDAVNLSWKLAGVIKGYLDDSVIDTYNDERQPLMERLTDIDEQILHLDACETDQILDLNNMIPSISLSEMINKSAQINIGLHIQYPENALNRRPMGSLLAAGTRAGDGLIYAPGSKVPVRMHQTMRYDGKFIILVFAGEPLHTGKHIISLRWYFDHSPMSLMKSYPDMIRYATILVGYRTEAEVDLGCQRFGTLWLDHNSSVHFTYSTDSTRGAIIVVRPDGTIGYAVGLDQGEKLAEYFGGFMRQI